MDSPRLQPLSPVQHAAFAGGQVPEPLELREGVWAVPMVLPHRFPGGPIPFSYTYVIDDFTGGLHLIDPGWNLAENHHRLQEFFDRLGRDAADVATITITHLHQDHLGLAEEVRRRSGATLVMHATEASAVSAAADAPDLRAGELAVRAYTTAEPELLREWGVPEERWAELLEVPRPLALPRPDVQVREGEGLAVPGRVLVVVETPGHTGGHMCIRDADHGLLFTGDHLLPGINSGIGLGGESPGGPVADFYASLDRMAEFAGDAAAPGHEFAFRGIGARAEQVAAHHRRRTQEVAELGESEPSVWAIAKEVTWSDGFAALRGYRLGSALAQVAMHAQYVGVLEERE